MVIPIEREDELKSVLQTQPATRLRSKPVIRSNDCFVDLRPGKSKIDSSMYSKSFIVYHQHIRNLEYKKRN